MSTTHQGPLSFQEPQFPYNKVIGPLFLLVGGKSLQKVTTCYGKHETGPAFLNFVGRALMKLLVYTNTDLRSEDGKSGGTVPALEACDT